VGGNACARTEVLRPGQCIQVLDRVPVGQTALTGVALPGTLVVSVSVVHDSI
jgi:hypothetical protein